MRLIDTHAHLSDLDDREGVIKRAKEIGIEAIVAVSANLITCRKTMDWFKTFPKYVYPALGIHATEWYNEDIIQTTQYIKEHIENCIAVGEIGLDYWHKKARNNSDIRERQRHLYINLLKMARNHEKPASVHSRGSWEDALRLARSHGPERIVFHWYSGPIEVLRNVLDNGYMISATPAVEFSKYHRTALVEAPLERIMMETDAPMSYHGKQGEPADLLLTLSSLAKLKDCSEEEIAQVTSRNAKRFFQF